MKHVSYILRFDRIVAKALAVFHVAVDQTYGCSAQSWIGNVWVGWWTAKRRLSDDITDYTACKSTPMVWALDTQLARQLPEQSWESKMWVDATQPDCASSYGHAFKFEMCVMIPLNFSHRFNDMMCDYPLCALCQLD